MAKTRDYGYIKQKVLDVAAHEINAKTDLEILDIYAIRKTGKKVETVRILFTDDVEKRGDEVALILSENYKKLGLRVFEGLPLESGRIGIAALSAAMPMRPDSNGKPSKTRNPSFL